MNKQEAALHRALCNFCNEAGDPFEPASQWDDNVRHAFGRLCDAYNEWYKTKITPEDSQSGRRPTR
jgi:hypothetical protein